MRAAARVRVLSSTTMALILSSFCFFGFIGAAVAFALAIKQVLARVWRKKRLYPYLLET